VYGFGDIMKTVHSNEEYVKMLLQDKISICLFTSFACSDCTTTKQIVADLVDRNELAALSKDLGVNVVPSFLSYKNGQELSRFMTPYPKTRAEIISYINMNCQKGGSVCSKI
jgi:hypothetical protein